MNPQGDAGLISAAVQVVNRLTDELEILFQELARLASDERPYGWIASRRTYSKDVEAGPHGLPRRLPQALYRLFLPGPLGHPGADLEQGDEDEEEVPVHVVLGPDTKVLVIAVVLYSVRLEPSEPVFVGAVMEDLKVEKWRGKARGAVGLRRKHLKALVETLDLDAVESTAVVAPRSVNGGKLGCRLRILVSRRLVSIASGEDIAGAWREIVGKLA